MNGKPNEVDPYDSFAEKTHYGVASNLSMQSISMSLNSNSYF